MQVVEDDERPELERRIDGAADGGSHHRGGAELLQRPDVGAVVDAAGEVRVARPVAGDVEHRARRRNRRD